LSGGKYDAIFFLDSSMQDGKPQGKPQSAHKGRYRRPKKPAQGGLTSPVRENNARKEWPAGKPVVNDGGPNNPRPSGTQAPGPAHVALNPRGNNPPPQMPAKPTPAMPQAAPSSTTSMDIDVAGSVNAPTFASLPIHPSLKSAIANNFQFETLTPCQAQTITPLLQNNDVHLLSKTGSGKTLAFLIPSISNLLLSGAKLGDRVSILVISPTRELAMQVYF
jgi:hypothetical protein